MTLRFQKSSEQKLLYIERRVDVDLRKIVEDVSFSGVIGIFEPSRRGKTSLVEHLAETIGSPYAALVNGSLKFVCEKIMKHVPKPPISISFDELQSRTFILAQHYFFAWFNYVVGAHSDGEKQTLLGALERIDSSSDVVPRRHPTTAQLLVMHIDELQAQYSAGANFYAIRKNPIQSSGRDYDQTVALMSLIQHFVVLARDVVELRIALVFSGVDFRGSAAINILSSNKFHPVSIPPITKDFAKAVLSNNGVVLSNADDEHIASLAGGSVGQLFSVVITKYEDGQANWNKAYMNWFHHIQERMPLSAGDCLAILCLLSQGTVTSDGDCHVYSWDYALRDFPFLDPTGTGHSSWLRIRGADPLSIEAPTLWHMRAFDTLMKRGSEVLANSFYTINAAAANDPPKQTGYLFQLLFGLELFTNANSPLFSVLGAKPTAFTKVERVNSDPEDWECGALYLVQESSAKKCGDIVFRDGNNTLFILELKNSDSSHYLNDGLQKFEAYVSSLGSSANGHQFRFVSATSAKIAHITALSNLIVCKNIAATPGMKINLLPTIQSLKCSEFLQAVFNPDHPQYARTLQNFALERMNSHVFGTKRPREETPSFCWVKLGDAVFKVAPATNDVDSLKKAVKAEASVALAGRDAFTLIVKDVEGNVLEADAPLAANTKEAAYIVE